MLGVELENRLMCLLRKDIMFLDPRGDQFPGKAVTGPVAPRCSESGKIFPACAVTREELRIDPAGSSKNTTRLCGVYSVVGVYQNFSILRLTSIQISPNGHLLKSKESRPAESKWCYLSPFRIA